MTGKKSYKNGNLYEYWVMDFLQRRGIKLEDIIRKNGNDSLSFHYCDLEVKSLNLRIEVKGSLLHYLNGQKGTFAFSKWYNHQTLNVFAFVFGKSRFIIFLTRKEFLDIIGRKWMKNSEKRYKRLRLVDVYDKGLNIREIYNF